MLTKRDRIVADLVKAAYTKNVRPVDYLNYKYDSDLSNNQIASYISDDDVLMCISGTHTSYPSDILTHFHIAFDDTKINDPRFDEALEIAMKLKEKHPKKTFRIGSHSMGSNVALNVSEKINVDGTINFNPYFPTTKYHT